MLADLEGNPLILVVDSPQHALVLESRAPCLSRWMDTPLVRGGKPSDKAFVNEGTDGLFENKSGREGPDFGSLSLERDLRGGIEDGLGGHVAEQIEWGVDQGRKAKS